MIPVQRGMLSELLVSICSSQEIRCSRIQQESSAVEFAESGITVAFV